MDLFRVFLDDKLIFTTTDKKAVQQAISVLKNMYDIECKKDGLDYVLSR